MPTHKKLPKVLQVAAIDATIAAFVAPLIDALQADGYCVDSACADGPKAKALRSMGYTVHRVAFSRRVISLYHGIALAQLIRLMRHNHYDIVHVHTPIASVLGRIAAKLTSVPIVIYTAHGFYFHENTAPVVRRFLIAIERFLCRHCTDMLLTVSCEDKETALIERFVPPDRVVCIRSVGVALNRFTGCAASKELRQSLGLSSDHLVVGFVGRLVKEKGIEDLVRAMREILQTVPEARLLVIGGALDSDRDHNTRRRIRRLLDESNLADAIILTGFREDIPDLLALVDVFVLPSYREGMPITILEAMASAKPVIATNIRGCREEVVDGVTGLLVPVANPAALARAIVKILSDAELRLRMGQEGYRRASRQYDQRRVLEEQLCIYAQLVQERERES